MRSRLALIAAGVLAGCLLMWLLRGDAPATPREQAGSHWTLGASAFPPWLFLASRGPQRDARFYSPLPVFNPNCCRDTPVPGMLMWSAPGGEPPSIGINTTPDTHHFFNTVTWPSGAVVMHPAPARLSVLGWRSPMEGFVRVRGRFADVDPVCGNGIEWFIDHNADPVAWGSYVNGGQQPFVAGTNGNALDTVKVKQGDVLFFAVGAREGDFFCDSTQIELSIDAVD